MSDFFQLFMFDFDGLIVDTERVHYQAYLNMCAQRGIEISWDFSFYCSLAHYSHDGVKNALYQEYPTLFQQEPNWNILYQEKTKIIARLFEEGAVGLMPGVEEVLEKLAQNHIKTCVVTHSSIILVERLKKQHPILQTITHWITREDYTLPKPNPECYQVAIRRYLPQGGQAIGFEDTIRGLNALMKSGATAYLVTSLNYPEIPYVIQQGAIHLHSFKELQLPQLSKV